MSANPVARPSSRRSFLTAALAGTAAGAVAGASHVAVSGMAEASPIPALVKAAEEASKRQDETIEATFDALRRYRELGGDPEVSGALLYRGEPDRDLCLYGSRPVTNDPTDERYTFSATAIEHFRKHPRTRFGMVPHPDLPPPNMRQTKEPWPEAQARADEIVAAWDARQAEIDRRWKVSGRIDAMNADAAAEQCCEAAIRAVILARVTTPEDVQAKASLMASLLGDADELTKVLEHEGEPCDLLALSIVRDILALRGQA